MKYRLSAIILIVLAGALIWFVKVRNAPPPLRPDSSEPATRSGVTVPTTASASNAGTAQAEPVSTESTPADAATLSPPEPAGAVPAKPKRPALAAAAEPPAGPEIGPGLAPLTVLENMRSVFRQYSQRFGGNPIGTNPEITAALNGGNPRQVVFLNPEDGMRVNERGELVDNWGTPYFFHQLSRSEMEIRSAGPDRKMWTSDDLMIK